MKGTHFLEGTDKGSSQDTEKTQQARGAHKLENDKQGMSQDMPIKISQGGKPQGYKTKN
jgi:hypothetical protein